MEGDCLARRDSVGIWALRAPQGASLWFAKTRCIYFVQLIPLHLQVPLSPRYPHKGMQISDSTGGMGETARLLKVYHTRKACDKRIPRGRETRQEDVAGPPTHTRISPSIQRILSKISDSTGGMGGKEGRAPPCHGIKIQVESSDFTANQTSNWITP